MISSQPDTAIIIFPCSAHSEVLGKALSLPCAAFCSWQGLLHRTSRARAEKLASLAGQNQKSLNDLRKFSRRIIVMTSSLNGSV